jgi:hypothetical protein
LEQAAQYRARSQAPADLKESCRLYIDSATYFVRNGAAGKAARILTKAAEVVQECDSKLARKAHLDAITIVEKEEKMAQFDATFKAAISFFVTHQSYDDALELLEKQNHLLLRNLDTMDHDLYKNILIAILIHFHRADYEKGQEHHFAMCNSE